MNKNNPSESDLCDKVIRPAVAQAGWCGFDQIYAQHPPRAGRVVARDQSAVLLLADGYGHQHLALLIHPLNAFGVGAGGKCRLVLFTRRRQHHAH